MMMKLWTEKNFGEKVKKCGTKLKKINKKNIKIYQRLKYINTPIFLKIE